MRRELNKPGNELVWCAPEKSISQDLLCIDGCFVPRGSHKSAFLEALACRFGGLFQGIEALAIAGNRVVSEGGNQFPSDRRAEHTTCMHWISIDSFIRSTVSTYHFFENAIAAKYMFHLLKGSGQHFACDTGPTRLRLSVSDFGVHYKDWLAYKRKELLSSEFERSRAIARPLPLNLVAPNSNSRNSMSNQPPVVLFPRGIPLEKWNLNSDLKNLLRTKLLMEHEKRSKDQLISGALVDCKSLARRSPCNC